MLEPPRISALFPEIFNVSRPIISGTSPLIVNANLLFLQEAQVLPVVEGLEPRIDPETRIKRFATFGGYSVLDTIVRAKPSDYQSLLWTKCQDMPIWIGSIKFTDTLDDLLEMFERTRYGDAVVEDEKRSAPALITLKEIVSLYRVDRLKSNLTVFAIGSEKVSISSDAYIIDALKLMFSKRIRRVFISGIEDGNRLRFVSGRDIIRFLFSPQRLEIVKKSPESWLDETLLKVPHSEARSVSNEVTVNQASRLMGNRADASLVCEGSEKVVSNWDVVMKPWKQGAIET